MIKHEDRNESRRRRHLRIRQTVRGSAGRPRLAVFRSLAHIYAQVIDDERQRTVAAASSLDPEIRAEVANVKKAEAGRIVGRLIARRAKAQGVQRVVFDRGGFLYHGRVRALADGAREGGLEF
ncbi:MAG: 50S ribosomal protein L18 [Bacillati bacterium ANGP1]|uniref:Large ribosomal subunit protein uL18 n=1 Tax=Candidatus Segetimicrobium genomatis TaxID=2569760 RepID=A0A537M000_9BACT|nr:MAG: 50S ribosomal protein L18 [Terrabacteria group bacterium ANGP1]